MSQISTDSNDVKGMQVSKVLVGGLSKTELQEQLHGSGILLNDYAYMLLNDCGFTVSNARREVVVVTYTPFELGLYFGATYQEIVQKAELKGYKVCTLELAVYLRLQYTEQLEGVHLCVSANPINRDISFPKGLYLRKVNNTLWLRGYRASDDFVFPPSAMFVFEQTDKT